MADPCMSNGKSHTLDSTILALMTMALGGSIYILLRQDTLLMFTWWRWLHLDSGIAGLRNIVLPHKHTLPGWLHLSLPQALWLLSGCLAIHAIWGNLNRRKEQVWMGVVLCLGLATELGQAMGVVRGTYDSLDLVLLVLAFSIAQVFSFFRVATAIEGGM